MTEQESQAKKLEIKRLLVQTQRDVEKILPKLEALEAYNEISFLKKAIAEIKKTVRQL